MIYNFLCLYIPIEIQTLYKSHLKLYLNEQIDLYIIIEKI